MEDSPPPPKQKRSRVSAGLLMFRRKKIEIVEVLLAHPGGPFFRNKDDGVWTIPKGEVQPDEDFLARAQIEFEEETGTKPSGNFMPLGSIKQKGGKTVHAWAVEGDLPPNFELKSNTRRAPENSRNFRKSTAQNFFQTRSRDEKLIRRKSHFSIVC